MNATISDVLAARSPLGRQGLNRMIGWSVALHVGVFVFLVVAPKDWYTAPAQSVPSELVSRPGG